MSLLRNASLAIAAAVVSFGLSSSAFAEDIEDRSGLYLSGTAGYTMPDDPDISEGIFDAEVDMDDGFSGTLALGYNYSAFRFEVEGGYRTNDFEINVFGPADIDGDLETFSGMVNAFYDFQFNEEWSIYVGAGAGAAFTTIDTGDDDEDDTVFAYQGMAGVGYAVNEDVTITAGYRIFHTDDYDFDGAEVDSPWIHTAEIGLRWDLQ